jgi:FdhD protein
MIAERAKITGVVLAGGRAKRMGGADKGLLPFKGRPLAAYALDALKAVVGSILINANRNQKEYAVFGYPVIADATGAFDGPLAGLFSAMQHADTPYVMTVPCDSPLIDGALLERLYRTLQAENAEICAAHDGERLHPVFLIAERRLAPSLEAYLATGQRKIDLWLKRHKLALADYSDHPELFANVNTPEELAALERGKPMTTADEAVAALARPHRHPILMSNAGLAACHRVNALDENGEVREIELAGERALTIYVDKYEIVTLMTIGAHPELLVLGYLRNQGFIGNIDDILSVQVDWETEAAAVVTRQAEHGFLEKLGNRTVTTGCGQGTVFGRLLDQLREIRVPQVKLRQSGIYELLNALREYNEVYKRAGAVHGCALCRGREIEVFVEDVGRHNAVDAIAGYMWLNDIDGADKVFYTTGRLTSEMVIKVTQMGIPVLLSRSGATQMGLELARQAGVTMISRAKGRHFLVLNGAENMVFDMPRDESRRFGQSRSENGDEP